MAKSPAKRPASGPKTAKPARTHLPDPKIPTGPYGPFTSDLGWDEAWWWLGFPIATAILVVVAYRVDPEWYKLWVVREGPGFLETTQFVTMVIGLAIAVQLLFDPFVRRRPLVLALTVLAALSCLYIAGEENMLGASHIRLAGARTRLGDQPRRRIQPSQRVWNARAAAARAP
jgi:hypothetical protein